MSFRDMDRGVALKDEGAYGHMKFHAVRFEDIRRGAIDAGVPGPIARITVTGCHFERVGSGAGFRNETSRKMKISDNVFRDIETRPITLGAKGGDNRYAVVRDNRIDGVGPGRHPIGILAYVDRAVIEGNRISDIHAEGRHEAISCRGRHAVVRDNTMVDAGGDVGAISLASGGPTLVERNAIRFTEAHEGLRNGIDVRQTDSVVSDNAIVGSDHGVYLRRGGPATVADNAIGPSAHQRVAVAVEISTGAVIPERAMRGLAIRGNTIEGIRLSRGAFRGIHFDINHHAGEHDARMDDVTIAGNALRDIDAEGGAIGVAFSHIQRADSHMRNVAIEGNDFRGVDEAVESTREHVKELALRDNVGVDP